MLRIISLIGLLVYFAVLLVAVTREKKNHSVLDYFFAGRTLPFWALSITFIASWWGAGSAISTADLAYTDGLGAFWYYGVPVLISTLLMILGAKGIRRVGYLTQGKMMEARYSKTVSKILSVMILIFMTLTAASQMVGIGTFFGTYLGLNYELAVVVGTGIVLIYSMFGGFRGVVLTDIIQFVLLLISAVAVFLVAMHASGGLGAIQTAAEAAGKTDYMSVTAGASKYMTYVITFGCAWMIQANVWQRISAAKTDRDARKMTVMSFFAYIPLYLIVVLTGMAGLVLFDQMPEGGVVTAVVVEYMPPALGALVFVGIAAAIMSTMDSLINTGAMTLAIDLRSGEKSEEEKLKFSRTATLLVTAVALVISLGIRSILEISWMASDVITTGVFVPLVAGFLWRRGNSKGAMAAMLTGLVYCVYNLLIGFGLPLPAFWAPQSALQVILGVALSLAVYVGVSLCTEPEYDKADRFIAAANLFGKRGGTEA
ncbi:MAG: sodium:solute symporter family protein [Pseudoflavonifractor capillosus]|uniref:sodium:solute symporter family protein n=1 Tax=Pseudoflavonifractor capillosus TaxID=106588 RepID=UPI0023F92936|nr:sodium:solute symporter family protein [Pseudoflavonifractor capillosus]MCI5928659.1 sodium:solute symporter family protein [Pseudoflavonifractor capillosus]MDY4659928.1 sodium:solute symporter family protein [Pseudoflavonifractor capillosus]